MRLLLLLLAGVLGGCGSAGEPRLVVRGHVTFDGKPLTSGAVVFHADADHGNTTTHEPRGELDSAGVYTVSAGHVGGCPPGWYRVTVIANAPVPNDAMAPWRSLIPDRYGKPETSGLSVEVKANAAPGAYDFELR